MAHSRNDLIREGVTNEVEHNDWTFRTSDAGAVDEEAIVDLVMRHVDPLVQENHDLKREVENLQEVTRTLRERAEQAEAVVVRQLGPCTGCFEAPEEYCPRHGRSYNDMVEHLDRMVGLERDRLARVEAVAQTLGEKSESAYQKRFEEDWAYHEGKGDAYEESERLVTEASRYGEPE